MSSVSSVTLVYTSLSFPQCLPYRKNMHDCVLYAEYEGLNGFQTHLSLCPVAPKKIFCSIFYITT